MGDAIKTIVTVLGMHRSGTSLCANLLHAMGVNMADTASPSPHNLRGHWERPRINDLNDQVFALFGRAWSDPAHLLSLPEGWVADGRVQAIRMALAAVLEHAPARLYGFKDPRTARLLPLWHQVFQTARAEPRYVYCIRNPMQVARSISARDRMARDQAEYRWLIYNAAAVAELGEAAVCVIPYEDWFFAPMETARRIAGFVGVPPPSSELVTSIIDPNLRHDDESLAPARPLARRLHDAIVSGVAASNGDGVFHRDLRAFCAHIGEFEYQVQPLLVDREVLRASVSDQNRVIGDLNAAIRALRQAA